MQKHRIKRGYRSPGEWWLELDNPLFESQFCYLLSVSYLVSCSSSLILSFFIFKMDIVMAFSYGGCKHMLRKYMCHQFPPCLTSIMYIGSHKFILLALAPFWSHRTVALCKVLLEKVVTSKSISLNFSGSAKPLLPSNCYRSWNKYDAKSKYTALYNRVLLKQHF